MPPRQTVHAEMPHHRILNLYAFRSTAAITLAAAVALGDYDVVLEAAHGVTVGQTLYIREADHQYQGRAVAVVSNTITMGTPFSYEYTANADAKRGVVDMSVDGSGTKQEFYVEAAPVGGASVHRFIAYIEDQTAMDTAKFGGIAALSKGIVIAYRNGSGELRQAQQAVRSNGEWAERTYDVGYDDKAPAGFFGLRCRRTWGGLDKSGAVPHLGGGLTDSDKIIVIVQDNLTDLDAFRIVFQGHYTEE